MSDAPDPEAEAGKDPTRTMRDDPKRDLQLEQQVLNLIRSWLRRTREASAARTEAALDRASFESFPASDPVAPAASQSERAPALEEIDCTMSVGTLVFRSAGVDGPRTDRLEPEWTIEGDASGGGRIRMRIWVEDAGAAADVPSALELEPVHASLRARNLERRVVGERRTVSRKLSDGFDRRRQQRRGATAGTPSGNGRGVGSGARSA
jgi:hypothetical protein